MMFKITSGQRIVLVGLEPDTVPLVIGELGPLSQFQYLLELEGESGF
jgi:NAD(P)H-nitrite reductase large subunit